MLTSIVAIVAGLACWTLASVLYERQPLWYLVVLMVAFIAVANFA